MITYDRWALWVNFSLAILHSRQFYIELVHKADPQLGSVMITIFTCVICPSVPTFQNFAIQNKIHVKIVIAAKISRNVGLADEIIDDIRLICDF